MHFPALLTALFIDRVLWNGSERRDFGWLRNYLAWWLTRPWLKPARHSRWLGLGPLIPPLLLVVWLQTAVVPALGAMLEFVFATLILLFSLGPRDLGRDVDEFLSRMSAGDIGADEGPAAAIIDGQAESTGDTAERVQEGILIGLCRRYIGPVFWFAVLGPAGAASYRLAERMSRFLNAHHPAAAPGDHVFPVLNWIPARLTAAGFAIAGNFDAVAAAWKQCAQNESECPRDNDLLLATGRAAMEHERPARSSVELVEDTMGLGWRNLTLWVAISGVASLLSIL
jgi:membrane protein required for beta-lactamase induction